jgi:hypothetical protein
MDNQQISDLHLAQGEACAKAYPSNKVKGLIDENDLVNFKGEKVPYYLLNPELTAFNKPRSTSPADSDEWWFGFLKKHNMIDYGNNPKTNIFNNIVKFIVNKEREYKSEVINYVKSKDQMVKTNAISNQIKKMIDNGIIESVNQSGQSVLSKGRYWNTHINLKGVNNVS